MARLRETRWGWHVARSTGARADERRANRLAPTSQQLLLRWRARDVGQADETGWKVAGQKAWRWGFTNDRLSVYTIDPPRAPEVVERLLGEDCAGVLGCDCLLAYDALKTSTQSKCASPLLRRGADILESQRGRAVRFSPQVARLWRAAITWKQRHLEGTISAPGYAVAWGRLAAALDRLLAGHSTDPDNARFAKLLRKQRPHLLTFLYGDALDPTNNAAEREIRPAVLMRKTNGGHRSETGAQTHSILTSIIRTCQKHGRDFVTLVKQVWRQPTATVVDIAGETAVPHAQGPSAASYPA